MRRAYLDLTGQPPSDGELATATTQLRDAGNTSDARVTLVDARIATAAFATAWIEELENAIFGGATLDSQYAFVCAIVRDAESCESCTETDSCLCDCPPMLPFNTERTSLRKAAADFGAGTTSSAIERRYALAGGYFVLAGSPEGRVRTLFDDFLARTAEPDEIENGRALILGTFLPASPAGLLFHRHGRTYDDLVDIVFDSEIYREAVVRRVFNRYLAREPGSRELAQLATDLDANDPDARDVVRAVVSSREYFDQ